MYRISLFLFSLLISLSSFSQFTENFNDGDFTSNPTWTGDVSQFVVDANFQLQSNGDTTSATNRKIYLSTSSELMSNIQWEFFVNPKAATSSNNYMDVYLVSDLPQLTGNNHGYFVRIGGTADEVALFRKDGNGLESNIIAGEPGMINSSSTNPTKVKVTRDGLGNWNLFADYEGTGNLYNFIGTTLDVMYTSTEWFGVIVSYSSSNRMKYFMDNIYVGPILVDETPPVINQVKVLGSNSVELQFSETVDLNSAQNTENYMANQGLGEPISAVRGASSFSRVVLIFGDDFAEGVDYQLSVNGVKDLSDNVMEIQQVNFLYYKAKPYEIVINELMVDPDPVVGLGPFEYLELFNRTPYPVNLENWMIKTGTSYRNIPFITIQPDSFLIVTNGEGEEFFYTSQAVIGLPSFSALTNTGATVSLLNPDSTVISTVSYQISWYNNSTKSLGGWSLEQISPFMPCAGAENWSASEHPSGGTPGRKNSIYSPIADNSSPEIFRAIVLGNDTVRVFFTETVRPENASDPLSYTIDNGVGHPIQVITQSPDFMSVKLVLESPLATETLYTISASSNLIDCAGNALEIATTGRFALPEIAEANDIVINEILTDPKEGGTDYVELYNRSNKIIDLGTLQISNMDLSTGALISPTKISTDGYLFFPGEYIVVSQKTSAITSLYYSPNPSAFLEMPSFPAYNNAEANVVLSRFSDQEKIDELRFNSSMHFALLNSLDGVALERIHPNRPSSDITNWNSAAATVGYGTPGYRNSQYSELSTSEKGSMTLSPEVFSPDNDGFEDALDIAYSFDLPGFTASISIYDSHGRLVKHLVRNQLVGTSGVYTWNGINEQNEKSRLGIYIVYLEAFDLNGNIVRQKKPCVLGGKI